MELQAPRGASMIDEYSDRKGYFGIIRTPIDSINKLAFKLAGTKFQMNTHAMVITQTELF